MLRSVLISVAVMAVGGQAFGQGEPFSFTGFGPSGTNVGTVPEGGFVLTDIFVTTAQTGLFEVHEGGGAGLKARFGTADTINSFNLQSGIPFASGTTINWTHNYGGGNSSYGITLSGYIPSTATPGTVPAVSTWGMLIMLGLVVIAGTVVFRRVKVAT